MSAESEDLSSSRLPETAVWPPPPTNTPLSPVTMDSKAILVFPRQSVWLLLFLTLITVGIYTNVWQLQQATRLQRFLPDQSLRPFTIGALIFAVISAAFDVSINFTSNASLNLTSSGLDLVYGILALILEFAIRSKLNTIQGGYANRVYWFSGVWTFLFGVLYLQYKINKNRALSQTTLNQPHY